MNKAVFAVWAKTQDYYATISLAIIRFKRQSRNMWKHNSIIYITHLQNFLLELSYVLEALWDKYR